MEKMTFVGMAGSLRKNSLNRWLLNAVKENAPEGVTLDIVEIGALPPFNQDLEMTDYPAEAQAIKDKINAAKGVIFATPEYNRSIPGVLKNATDWISRPYGTNPFAGKIVVTMGATHGNVATALAQSHLKQIMMYLNARVMGQPEFYLSGAPEKFDANGVLIDEPTKQHIVKLWDAVAKEAQR